jgi:hypothetical protein
LIGRGKKVFEAALENPELLIKFIPVELAGEIEGEQLMYSGSTAYEELTGKENLEELLSTNTTLPVIDLDWTDENVNDKFPKLAKKFC